MRVLGLIAASGAVRMAVLETDGRTVGGYGPAAAAEDLEAAEAFIGAQNPDLIGLVGEADGLARRTGIPVAFDFGPFAALSGVYYRALVSARGLERPAAVIDGERTFLIAANGLLTVADTAGPARTVVRTEDLGRPAEALEAEAAAFLAARCWNGLPVAFPGTTGAPYPMTGGRIAWP